jgi:hypothetical protein
MISAETSNSGRWPITESVAQCSTISAASIRYADVRRLASRQRIPKQVSRSDDRPKEAIPEMLSGRKVLAVVEDDLERARELLANKAGSLVIQLQNTLGIERLNKSATFAFFRRLLNFAPYKLHTKLRYDSHLDYFACDSMLECYRAPSLLSRFDYDFRLAHTAQTPIRHAHQEESRKHWTHEREGFDTFSG